MSTRIARFAPIGAVAGVLGYLCWPYLDDPAKPRPAKANKAAELTSALLSPPAAADLTRNVFESSAAPSASPPPTVQTSSRQATETSPKQRIETVTSAPESLVLNGTFVRGSNRVALINDALYTAGDQIPEAIANAKGCRVRSVEIDRVLLDVDGRRAELVYRDLLASAADAVGLASADGQPGAPPRPATSTGLPQSSSPQRAASAPNAPQPAKSPAK